MNLFVELERAGDGFHLLREASVWGPAPLGGYPRQKPRDRVYTVCGYRVPSDGYCPRYVMVAGEERPEVVPISIDYVCAKCRSAISVDEAIMLRLDIESVIHECQVWHLRHAALRHLLASLDADHGQRMKYDDWDNGHPELTDQQIQRAEIRAVGCFEVVGQYQTLPEATTCLSYVLPEGDARAEAATACAAWSGDDLQDQSAEGRL